jgi:electron transfer flavoprotein beta subunit
MLGVPHVNVATATEIEGSGPCRVEQETDAGKQVMELNLPAVVTVQKGINNPRYASAIMIMKGKKKPREVWDAEKVGFKPGEAAFEVLEYIAPPKREPGRVLTGEVEETVPELVRILNEEKKLV